ncbi:hypothetical protein ASH00_03855 [Arthrobacter sp. Soil782]|uniref:DUF1206 domain-containing protein n=1 Tax=Arthrobacter sp. Soil782 TaxID=1736410 RepID=UPI0006F3D002|nr:DUF1206 domain-containing protein [Arthrobacter sp. Soil782]KRF08826.1 hypothetical protein ASH00_03855 [Arthrobacter sp. Soil782]
MSTDENLSARGAADTAEEVSDHKALDVVARFGFAVLAVVHILIGIIALQIAFGGSGEAETTGALEQLAGGTSGPWTMWACSIGCLGLAAWQLSEGTLRARHLPTGERVSKTISSGSLSIIYGTMAVTFARFAFGGEVDSSESTRDFTASMMGSPPGNFVILAVGGTVFGIGVHFVFKGLLRKFRPELRHFEDTHRGALIEVLGVIGHVAKGIALILVGILFVTAVITHDPSRSTGLDGSLKALTDHPFGDALLVSIAVGLICYGIFALLRAKFGRM